MRASQNTRPPAFAALIALVLAAAQTLFGPGIRVASAGALTTQSVLEIAQPEATRQRLHDLVEREEVARELERLGVGRAEAHRRIGALSAGELAAVQGRLDQLPAGAGAVGAVVGALLIVFIILLITDIAGLTDVFPFVRKPARR